MIIIYCYDVWESDKGRIEEKKKICHLVYYGFYDDDSCSNT